MSKKKFGSFKNLSEMTYLEKLLKLFVSTFAISAVAFGGGFVVLPMMRRTYVENLRWIDDADMQNYIAIAQSSPGTIAGNTAMVIGFKIAGVLGAVVCAFASVLPPFLIITAAFYLYNAIISMEIVRQIMYGMQAGVSAVILDFVVKMISDTALGKSKIFAIVLMCAAFIASFFFSFSVIYIILVAVVIGIAFLYSKLYCNKKKGKTEEEKIGKAPDIKMLSYDSLMKKAPKKGMGK
ncbi:MAG: chromate transporter [Clostridiales bacterium]|nr:chromate transporter [Clostridiales bacterium]